MATAAQIKICLMAAAETLAECREMPAGHLYAALMTKGLVLSDYEIIERCLVEVLAVRKDASHLLTWTDESDRLMAAARAQAGVRA